MSSPLLVVVCSEAAVVDVAVVVVSAPVELVVVAGSDDVLDPVDVLDSVVALPRAATLGPHAIDAHAIATTPRVTISAYRDAARGGTMKSCG